MEGVKAWIMFSMRLHRPTGPLYGLKRLLRHAIKRLLALLQSRIPNFS